jgi:hypothetical protein
VSHFVLKMRGTDWFFTDWQLKPLTYWLVKRVTTWLSKYNWQIGYLDVWLRNTGWPSESHMAQVTEWLTYWETDSRISLLTYLPTDELINCLNDHSYRNLSSTEWKNKLYSRNVRYLSFYATSRNVTGSLSGEVSNFLKWHNATSRTNRNE